MSLNSRVGLLAGAAALGLTGVSVAGPASETTTDDALARLAAAEARIAQLEAANNQNWLTEQRAEEIKGLVQDVLADADTRASLLQTGMTSGYDNGFVLGSSDGNWLLRTNFHMQQRFIWNHQDDDDDTFASDSYRYGFENTRSKFILSGHVVNPNWFYLVEVNVGSNSLRTGTGSAYLGYDYGNGWSMKVGTMKAPLLREELVAAQHQLAVERSNMNYTHTNGYVDGIAVEYKGDQFRATGMFYDGLRTGQTIWSTYDTEYAFGARGEFLANGNWDQFDDFTSPKDGEVGVMIGGAVAYQDGEYGTPATETAIFDATADISVEFGGANLFAAIVYSDFDTNGATTDVNPWGFVIQGGFYLNESWELFGRYEWTDYDSAVEDLSIVTIGVNKYFSGHNAKWTTDIAYGFDEVQAPADITGFRPDSVDQDSQVVIRTQWQILF